LKVLVSFHGLVSKAEFTHDGLGAAGTARHDGLRRHLVARGVGCGAGEQRDDDRGDGEETAA